MFLEDIPQGLKPGLVVAFFGLAKAMPLLQGSRAVPSHKTSFVDKRDRPKSFHSGHDDSARGNSRRTDDRRIGG